MPLYLTNNPTVKVCTNLIGNTAAVDGLSNHFSFLSQTERHWLSAVVALKYCAVNGTVEWSFAWGDVRFP